MEIIVLSAGMPTSATPLSGVFAFDQAKALKHSGYRIQIVVIDLASIRHRRKYGIYHLKKDGMDCIVASYPLGRVPVKVRTKIGSELIRYLFRKKVLFTPDLIHAHFGDVGAMAVNLSKTAGIPLIITEHSSSVNTDRLSARKKAFWKSVYGNASSVIAVSSALAEKIKTNTGIDSVVVNNIVDTSVFQYGDTVLSDERFRIVNVGNLIDIKNQKMLIDAFSIFLQYNVNSELHIIGDGKLKESLKLHAQQLGIEHSVIFHGRLERDEIQKIFLRSDVFAFTSKSETFGVACIEAMAAGLPVISTDCGGPADFITPSNGLIVKKNTAQCFADGLITVYENYNTFDRKEISESVRMRFSEESVVRKLASIYSHAVEREWENDTV